MSSDTMNASSTHRSQGEARVAGAGWPGPALFDAGAASSALLADPRLVASAVGRPARPVVWLLSDDKAGHVNQLRGLGERLEALSGARLVWVSCRRHRVSWWQALAARQPRIEAPAPDLVIGAGSGTHALLLACRGFRDALTVVLMRPGFPSRWVDLKVIPEHDRPAARGDILATQGALTAVRPNPRLSAARRGLVLLGGESPHFHWRDDSILDQLLTLLREYPDWRWTVTSSRRTPAPLVARLRELRAPNLRFHHHDDTPVDWLPHQLRAHRVAWVSPDSVSMLYESLTAGVATGTLDLACTGKARVAGGIRALCRRGQVLAWRDRAALMAASARPPHLWEANRVAHWLIDRYQEARL
ncbi:ELM1/GtrOC1 family putative glycosyltransferase [Alloalcanivorax sp. C16-2]|uniref:ELM1/GtrOC1 family putative glycosyltransferase n=1 Tax=Alloalcanivorax sp. C16-2 TaxID=3390052 RepID=UPI003970565A